jgi:hypothetical protein
MGREMESIRRNRRGQPAIVVSRLTLVVAVRSSALDGKVWGVGGDKVLDARRVGVCSWSAAF